MVPGSTLMYGSSLTMVTLRPRASRMAPREAEAMPLPNEETTPPVTKTNWVICWTPESGAGNGAAEFGKTDYQSGRPLKSVAHDRRVLMRKKPHASVQRRMVPPFDAQTSFAGTRRMRFAGEQPGHGQELPFGSGTGIDQRQP